MHISINLATPSQMIAVLYSKRITAVVAVSSHFYDSGDAAFCEFYDMLAESFPGTNIMIPPVFEAVRFARGGLYR